MASLYILFSPGNDCFYIGSTKDIVLRLKYHDTKEFLGSVTSKYNDWELFLSINNIPNTAARKIETHIKKMKSKTYIRNLKKYPETREYLIKKYSLDALSR